MSSLGPSASTGANACSPRFQGIRTLGKGAHGFVQLAIDNKHEGQQVAIKYIPRGETASFYKYVLREVLHHQQLSLCKHPHIVEFHEVFLTPRYLGVVMEFIDGQDLQAYLMKAGGTLPEDIARFVFQQLVVAVDFIHKKGKVNRDIKLANVLVVDSGTLPLVKMCDFGFSKDKFDDSAPQTQIGTALFTAPEVFLNVQGHVYEGEAVDVWSCGVVLHMLLFGRHPFLSATDMELSPADQMVKLIENTVKGRLHVPEAAEGSSAADIVRRILVPSPKQRYGIKDILVHPWFQDKLPPGAMELNSAYLPAANYQNARQTPDSIKQIIRNAVQVIGPDGKVTGGPVPSTNSFDIPDSPPHPTSSMREDGSQQQHQQQQQQRHLSQQAQQPQRACSENRPPQQIMASLASPPNALDLNPQFSHNVITTQSQPVTQSTIQTPPLQPASSHQPSYGMPLEQDEQRWQQQHLKQRQEAAQTGSCSGDSGALQQQQQQRQQCLVKSSSLQHQPQLNLQQLHLSHQHQHHHLHQPQHHQQTQQQHQPQHQQHWQMPPTHAATPTSGYDAHDTELMDMLQLLEEASPHQAEEASRHLQEGHTMMRGPPSAPEQPQPVATGGLDPDPHVEALLGMDMDVSGNVLFDSSLLKMIQFNQFD